jgi:hypothetical protein
MDAEAQMLLETELRGMEDSWEVYALSGFRLAKIVTERVESVAADFAAQRVLAHYERSGEPKADANLDDMVSDIDGLTGVVRVLVGGTREPKRTSVRGLLERVWELERQLGVQRTSDGQEALLGITATTVEQLRDIAERGHAPEEVLAALRVAVRYYDLVRKAWEGVREEYDELQTHVDTAVTWLVTVKADQPASIIADRAKLALEALRAAATTE